MLMEEEREGGTVSKPKCVCVCVIKTEKAGDNIACQSKGACVTLPILHECVPLGLSVSV